jgi:hypothetical protein
LTILWDKNKEIPCQLWHIQLTRFHEPLGCDGPRDRLLRHWNTSSKWRS